MDKRLEHLAQRQLLRHLLFVGLVPVGLLGERVANPEVGTDIASDRLHYPLIEPSIFSRVVVFILFDQSQLVGVVTATVVAPEPQYVVGHITLAVAVVARHDAPPLIVRRWQRLVGNLQVQDAELGLHVGDCFLANGTLVAVVDHVVVALLVDQMATPHEHHLLDQGEHVLVADGAVGVGVVGHTLVLALELDQETDVAGVAVEVVHA